MRSALVLVALVAALGACGKSGRQRRGDDAGAPVEIVTKAQIEDAGTAGTSDEIEPNDGDDTATALPVGGTARGRIEPDSDIDQYKLDVTEPGTLVVELSGIDGFDLALEIEDATGTVIAKSDRPGPRTKEGVPNVGVTPGRYMLVVRGKEVAAPKKKAPKPKKGKKAPAPAAGSADATPAAPRPVYELTARVQPTAQGAEREPNDDRGTAMDLIVGDLVAGYLGWSGDADVWKLSVETLSEKNAIDVELSAVEGSALTVEVADGIGQVLATRKAPRGAPLAIRGLVPVVPAGAPPFHYLTVKADRSNPETAYQLRVTAKMPATDAELEPNDTPERAMAVPADRTIVHATWTPGDVDCFAIAAEDAPRTLELSLDVPPESDLAAELLVDGKVIATSDTKGKGTPEKVAGPVPAGATAVLRVRGTEASGEGAYDVQVAEGPAPP